LAKYTNRRLLWFDWFDRRLLSLAKYTNRLAKYTNRRLGEPVEPQRPSLLSQHTLSITSNHLISKSTTLKMPPVDAAVFTLQEFPLKVRVERVP
jgi:hypothetical protein